jgi:hypothetical protein
LSEIRANTVSDAAGTGPVTLTGQYAAKAWVNFDGTGTVAIRASGNVTSITDDGTGLYTVNFTTAMTDANYAMVASGSDEGSGPLMYVQQGTRLTTACPTQARDRTGTNQDTADYQCGFFR